MEKLTAKEEEVLNFIWTLNRPCSPKQIGELYDAPRPHVNTIATSFQSLEKKGYLTHQSVGRGYLYSPVVKREDYGRRKLKGLVANFFAGSYLNVVNTFVRDSDLTREELEQLLEQLKEQE